MIYPHTITVWTKSFEGRQALWDRVVYQKCRFEDVIGASSSTDGDVSERSAELIVKCYAQPFNKGDKVVPVLSVSDTPPKNAYVVQTVTPIFLSAIPHHWEAVLA